MTPILISYPTEHCSNVCRFLLYHSQICWAFQTAPLGPSHPSCWPGWKFCSNLESYFQNCFQVAEHPDHRRAQQREAQRRNLARRDSCWTAGRRGCWLWQPLDFLVTLLSTGELPGGRDWLCCCGQGGCLGCWCLQGRSVWQPWNLSKEANPQVLLADSPAYTGFLPEHLTPLLVSAQNQFKYTHIVAVGRSHSCINMYDFSYFSINLLHNISMETFSGRLRLLPLSVAPLGRPARRLSHLWHHRHQGWVLEAFKSRLNLLKCRTVRHSSGLCTLAMLLWPWSPWTQWRYREAEIRIQQMFLICPCFIMW